MLSPLILNAWKCRLYRPGSKTLPGCCKRRSSRSSSLIGRLMLMLRNSGSHTRLAQSGATRMTWAWSFLIFFRTRCRGVSGGKAYSNIVLHSRKNASQRELSLELQHTKELTMRILAGGNEIEPGFSQLLEDTLRHLRV